MSVVSSVGFMKIFNFIFFPSMQVKDAKLISLNPALDDVLYASSILRGSTSSFKYYLTVFFQYIWGAIKIMFVFWKTSLKKSFAICKYF